MINIYDTRNNPEQLSQEKVIAIMDHYYHPSSESQPALIGKEPIINLYQYLQSVYTALESAVLSEESHEYRLTLYGRMYELQHILYIIDKPEAIPARIDQSAVNKV